MMKRLLVCLAAFLMVGAFHGSALIGQNREPALQIAIHAADGSYTVGTPGLDSPVLTAGVAVQLAGVGWLKSRDYPKHTVVESKVMGDLGEADQWTVTFTGLPGKPDLRYRLRAYVDQPFADIQVIVRDTTARPLEVESIRAIEASGPHILNLGGSPLEDRVLSDSFSENRPAIKIRDLKDAVDDMHLGVGSQLIYNRQSHIDFFAGALTSNRFLTVLRIHLTNGGGQKPIAAFEADSTGTTELEKQYALKSSPPEDWVPLKVHVMPGKELASETLLMGIGKDYHQQLDTYGSLIKHLHHARVTAPTPMGWWSWTAYYFGLNEGTALTNARWLAQHLKSLGYDFFHIDEGYQYARGDYTTPNATVFPNGMIGLEWKIRGLGLVPGLWTAPFDVSNRSSIYQNHRDWLVHNEKGEPIRAGAIANNQEKLFVLDPTNPGAQEYLRKTYSTLVNTWGIRYIKLDFMDDSAVEGVYYRPNTTAMEAQRIGLGVIRQAVGDTVLLDKDGSPMLNPVGYVDFGRVSQDTRHTFTAVKVAATGVAARYYMNRNFFVSDPDAFTVSTQRVSDHTLPKGQPGLTLDEAKVSIALSAISGGMFEIGDDLPTLGSDPARLALVQNKDLIDMVRLGRSSTPVDLMTYLPEDEQPSIFFLREDSRQSILTIFNWTDKQCSHTISLSSLHLYEDHKYRVSNILDRAKDTTLQSGSITVTQPPHSVRMFKMIDLSSPPRPPHVLVNHPTAVNAGESVTLEARDADTNSEVISYTWDCGDGVTLHGEKVRHAYTRSGQYKVTLTATGLDGLSGTQSFSIPVTGTINTMFIPKENKRYSGAP